ncbi:MAG: hypothetical protein KDI44_05070 [Thiothrix sp.]|nr:hypothetical protein [Thiothrix sp.]HPQ95391.1 hypothetical protein [Thiolinea sp.]
MKHRLIAAGLVLAATAALGACSTSPDPEVSGTGPVITGSDADASGPDWAVNEAGKPHTHVVDIPDCPGGPHTFTHVHEGELAQVGLHRHDGCFTCPEQPLVNRLLQQ